MRFITKLLRADKSRRTRFHCANGIFVDRSELLRLPHSLLLWIGHRAFGTYSPHPWWVWGAIHAVSTKLSGDDVVLEHGSGMSSVWLAHRSAHVTSIETSHEWQKRVASKARRARVNNLDIKLANHTGAAEFNKLLKRIKPTVVVIDGVGDRLELLYSVLEAEENVRIIIYDNVDRSHDSKAYIAVANAGNWSSHSFRGFAPAQLHANETVVFFKH